MSLPSSDKEVSIPESLEELKRLVVTRLEQACADEPDYHWLWYETVEIDEMAKSDPDKVKRLLFGGMDDVEQAMSDDNWEALHTCRREKVEEILKDLIDGDLASVIDAFAEREGLDAFDLSEELKEDDEFAPENLEVPYIDTDFTYRGKVAVTAPLNIMIGFDPDEDLLGALRVLRIPIADYLGACRTLMESQGLTLDDPGPFEGHFPDDADEAGQGLAEAYEAALLAAVRASASSGLFAECEMQGPSAVDPLKLVESMREWGEKCELHVHTACSEVTIATVSKAFARHELDADSTWLRVDDGVIANASSPDDVYSSVRIAGRIALPGSSFEVLKDRPVKVRDEVSLPDHLSSGVYLVRDLERFFKDPSMLSADRTESLLGWADRVPAFRAQDVRDALPTLPADAPSHLERARAALAARLSERAGAALSEREQAQGLLTCLSPWTDGGSGRRDMALWLIDKGADVNAALTNGVTPLMLAAYLQDSSIVGSLLSAGADVRREALNDLSGAAASALSIAAAPLTGYRNVPGARACVADLLRAGAALPLAPVQVKLRSESGPLAPPLLLAVSTGVADLVRRTAEDADARGAAISQALLNRALYLAGRERDFEVGCVLLDVGASLNGRLADGSDVSQTIYEALRTKELALRGNTERADEYCALLQAHAAREAIARVTAGVRARIGKSRP